MKDILDGLRNRVRALEDERAAILAALHGLHPEAEFGSNYSDEPVGSESVSIVVPGPCYSLGHGGETELGWDKLPAYLSNPVGFCAALVGLCEADYRDWVAGHGTPLCGGITKRGKPCRNSVGRSHQDPKAWKALHREVGCAVHSTD